jgi:hypothetical protein
MAFAVSLRERVYQVHEMIGNWINYILQETGKRLSKF